MRRLFSGCVFAFSVVSAAKSPDAVSLVFGNEADVPLRLSWLNTWSKNVLVHQREEPILPTASMNIDSFRGHSFVAADPAYNLTHYTKEYENAKMAVKFTMSTWGDEIKVIRAEDGTLQIISSNSYTRAGDLMKRATEKCTASSKTATSNDEAEGTCSSSSGDHNNSKDVTCTTNPTAIILTPEVLQCITEEVAATVAPQEQALTKTRKILDVVGDSLRNYTCVDPTMDTTEKPLREFQWENKKTRVYLDEPHAKIMLIDNFASDAECKELTDTASKNLRAVTVSGKSGDEISPARRAKAGGLAPNITLQEGENLATDLYRRGYRFANDQTGYNIQLEGQEGFSIIKYDSTDEYLPHCDGDCTGAKYKLGGRVATVIVYCEAADVGGGTTFSNSDVFIKGKKGQAAFFSYYDAATNRTDSGSTRHSGCPIITGTKWIATMWMRLGVTKEHDYNHFDPQGRPSAKKLLTAKKLAFSNTDKDKHQPGSIDKTGTAAVPEVSIEQERIDETDVGAPLQAKDDDPLIISNDNSTVEQTTKATTTVRKASK